MGSVCVDRVGSGHYTAYGCHDSRWYHFNDSTVTLTEENTVRKAKAYILFYVERPDQRTTDETASDTVAVDTVASDRPALDKVTVDMLASDRPTLAKVATDKAAVDCVAKDGDMFDIAALEKVAAEKVATDNVDISDKVVLAATENNSQALQPDAQ